MPEYDMENWLKPSPCLAPAPPDNVGIGALAIGQTYPTMDGGSVKIVRQVTHEGEEYLLGCVTTKHGSTVDHYYQMNGRDWTDNPNNIYAIDWPMHDARLNRALEEAAESGWGR
jgi:hypothetical protein